MKTIIDHLSNTNVPFWEDLLLSSILIPNVGFLFYIGWSWWTNNKPVNLLLKRFNNSNSNVLIFTAQLSQAVDGSRVQEPKYLQIFPCPTPDDKTRVCKIDNKTIDPVWSEGDGLCISEIFNLFGSVKMKNEVIIANTMNDWYMENSPIISVGFNVKTTQDLQKKCREINYSLSYDPVNRIASLSIKGFDHQLHDINQDAGIIQKTSIKETESPVMILAGIGTNGTAVAGYVFRKNAADLGRLYGDSPFCLLFKTNMNGGKSYEIKGVFPKPSYLRLFLHPLTYFRWFRKGFLPK